MPESDDKNGGNPNQSKAPAATDPSSRGNNNTNNRSGEDNTSSSASSKPNSNQNKNQRQVFKGRTEEMLGHVFEMPAKANQYSNTMEVLQEYVSKTFTTTASEMMTLFDDPPTQPEVEKGPRTPEVPDKFDTKTGVNRCSRIVQTRGVELAQFR